MSAVVYKVDIDSGHEIPSCKYIFELYPGLKEVIKGGDIIENSEHCGYRASGCFIYDNKTFVNLDTEELTPYGFVPIWIFIKYKLPFDYYDLGNIILNNDYSKDKTKTFYFHIDYPSEYVVGSILDIINDNITNNKILEGDTAKTVTQKIHEICNIMNL
jgi:hypothetical protein